MGHYKIKIAEPRAQPPLLINLTDINNATSVPIFLFSFYATCFKFRMPEKLDFFISKENLSCTL